MVGDEKALHSNSGTGGWRNTLRNSNSSEELRTIEMWRWPNSEWPPQCASPLSWAESWESVLVGKAKNLLFDGFTQSIAVLVTGAPDWSNRPRLHTRIGVAWQLLLQILAESCARELQWIATTDSNCGASGLNNDTRLVSLLGDPCKASAWISTSCLVLRVL